MSGVFIAMPVYRGAEVIEETLRSILAQTYEDFHLVMSVDGAHDPTVEVCRRYAADPRVEVVVQKERLGWPGNLNRLIGSCDQEYFCYWQQDDLASTGYLEALVKAMAVRPDAAIAYTDVQWFGAAFGRDSTPGIEGEPLARVMQHIEAIRYEPLRGVMRSAWLPDRPDPIPVTRDESHQEEFVFLARMAAAGAFVRVADAMYFKRLHTANAFMRWRGFPEWRRRRGWLSMGRGLYEVARSLAPPEIRPRVLAHIVDRLSIQRPGRGFFYDTPQTDAEIRRFAHDLVAMVDPPDSELELGSSTPGPLERPIHPAVIEAISQERALAERRRALGVALGEKAAVEIRADQLGGSGLLGYGWSHPEPWGVWTDGDHATLRLPDLAQVEVVLEGHVFPDGEPVHVRAGAGGTEITEAIQPGSPAVLRLTVAAGQPALVSLDLPDAKSPADLGISHDSRLLGFGLERVGIRAM